jgi:DNA polymerase III gamma/tau subunit
MATQLHEKYRPRNWSEIVGQDKAVDKINQLCQRGLAGRAYWLSGQSGSGKTTLAKLIASEIADEFSTTPNDHERQRPCFHRNTTARAP